MTNIPYRYYQYQVNGKNYVDASPTGDIPNGGSEIGYDDFITAAKAQPYSQGVSYYDYLASSAPTTNGIGVHSDALIKGNSSGYTTGPNGQVMSAPNAANFTPSPQEAAAGVQATGTGTTQPTQPLTQDQLNTQNAANGVTQNNPNPAKVGGAVDAAGNPTQNNAVGNTPQNFNSAGVVTPTASPNAQNGAQTQANAAPVSSYIGPSIVDYLNSVGQPSSFAARAQLAQQMGIQNYSGTAAQNTQMLGALRSRATSTTSGTSAPAGGSTAALPSNQPQNQPGAAATVATPKDFTAQYQDIISSLGLTDIKAKFDEVNKQYEDLQGELTDKISDVNDDPWLSEGVRQKKVQQLQDRYDSKLTTLQNKIKIYDSLYKEGVDQAKFLATGEAKSQQDAFNNAMDLQDAATKLATTNPANFKEVQGGLYDVSSGEWIIQPKATPTASDKTDAAVQSLATTLTGAKGTDGYTDPNLYARLRQSATISPTDFDNRFGYLVNPLSRAKLGITATVAGGGGQFLNADWFKSSYTTDQLYSQAQTAGKGVGLFGSKDQAVTDYLADLQKTIDAYRSAGFSDNDILKMMK